MEEKYLEYGETILEALQETIFNEESEFFIDHEELKKGDNATEFLHALANIVPTAVYFYLTDEQISMLNMNHLANALVFQYKETQPTK